MKPDQARGLFAECCGSARWANEMTAARPFHSRDEVFNIADRVDDMLEPKDWLEAFVHHPRIGDDGREMPQGKLSSEWEKGEQSGVDRSDNPTKAALINANQEYERKFGYIYIVCATGKTGEEMLKIAEKRLGNDPEKELRVAADEQRKITRLRLEKLLEAEKEKGARR